MYKKRSRSSQHLQLQINEEGTTPLSPPPALSSSSSSKDDVFNMLLLVILYAMQGVPLGLTLGSIPFILKAHASYTEVGFFSLASYPYSMKLIWSPIVDTVFSSKIGWRKSWKMTSKKIYVNLYGPITTKIKGGSSKRIIERTKSELIATNLSSVSNDKKMISYCKKSKEVKLSKNVWYVKERESEDVQIYLYVDILNDSGIMRFWERS